MRSSSCYTRMKRGNIKPNRDLCDGCIYLEDDKKTHRTQQKCKKIDGFWYDAQSGGQCVCLNELRTMKMALDKMAIDKCGIMLSKKEQRLIELLRGVKFGKVEVHIEDGQPVRVIRIAENILLTNEVVLKD